MKLGSVALRRGWVLSLTASAVLLMGIGFVSAQESADTDADPAAAGEMADDAGMDSALDDTTGMEPAAAPPVVDTPAEPPVKQGGEGQKTAVVELYQKGGFFMHFLAFCSIAGLAAIIERFITLQRASTNTKKLIARIIEELRTNGVRSAIEVCQSTRGPIAAIIHSGLTKADQGPAAVEKAIEAAGGIEVAFLQRGLMIIATVANVAPLLGFLGTVSGMINAFDAIAAAEQVSAKLVASGISEALITTATGLIVAIPMQISHNYFLSRIDRFIIEMEESSIDLVNELEAGNIKP